MMQAWIGTSGYSYPDWVGPFYPPGTRAGRMLAHYCRHFPLVELNFTFYRLPTAAVLTRLADQTPDGFQFIIKLPRSLSHEEDPRDVSPLRRAVEELAGRGRLLSLLCQLPQASHHDGPRRAWLETLARALTPYPLAVEFRHRSWFHAEVPPWLAEHRLDLVAVDVPDLPGLYPRGLVRSSPNLYVRFHSRNAANWYRSDKDRYDYDYGDAALAEWVEALCREANEAQRVLLLFNNCQRGQAAANARRMGELLAQRAPAVEVVGPVAPPESGPRQRLLFE